jgi:hypothetical protein
MAARRYPHLECGKPTEGEDRHVVCDDCLAELAWQLAEQRKEMAAADDRGLRAMRRSRSRRTRWTSACGGG